MRKTEKKQPCSSVSQRLLGYVVILFLSTVDQLNCVGVLSYCKWLLSFLVSNEGLSLINIVAFTLSESQMITFVSFAPNGGKQVRDDNVEELRHVDNIEEFSSISHIEPHPVTVGLQTDRLDSQKFYEVGSRNH